MARATAVGAVVVARHKGAVMISIRRFSTLLPAVLCLALVSCQAPRHRTVEGPPIDLKIFAGTTETVIVDDLSFAQNVRSRPQEIHVPGRPGSEHSGFVALAVPHGPKSVALLIEARSATPAGRYNGQLTLSFGFGKPGVRSPVNIRVVPLQDPVSGSKIIPKRPSFPSSDRVAGGRENGERGAQYLRDELIVLLDVNTPFDHTTAEGEICGRDASCFVCPPPQKDRNAPVADEGGIACAIANETGGLFLGSVPEARAYQLRFPELQKPEDLERKRTEILLLSREFPAITAVSRSFLGGPAPAFAEPADYDPSLVPNNNKVSFDAINALDAWDKATTLSGGGQEMVPAGASLPIPGNPPGGTPPRIPVAVIDVDFRDANGHQEFVDTTAGFDNVGFLSYTNAVLGDTHHGKKVAGLIGARGNTVYMPHDIAGMIWDVELRLYDFRQGYELASLPGTTDFEKVGAMGIQMLDAMVRAINNKTLGDDSICKDNSLCIDGVSIDPSTLAEDLPHPRVINISYAFFNNLLCNVSQTPADETNAILGQGILYAVAQNKDILWVIAAGDNLKDAKCEAPAALSGKFPANTMTVAAADASAASPTIWTNSNTGPLVTVAAPGVKLRTVGSGTTGYVTADGSSLAAPIVSGLAALIYSQNKDHTARRVKQCIVGNSTTYITDGSGTSVPFIDAGAAMPPEQGDLCPTGSIALNDPARRFDIIFSFDTTGSMGAEINQVKINANNILNAINTAVGGAPGTGACDANDKLCYAVVSYEDYPDSAAFPTYDSAACNPPVPTSYNAAYGSAADLDEPFRVHQTLTADSTGLNNAVETAINDPLLTTRYGRDGPESYARVFWEIAEDASGNGSIPPLGFITGRDSIKIIINFGDNVPHDIDLTGSDLPLRCNFADLDAGTGKCNAANICPNPPAGPYVACICDVDDVACNRLAGLKVLDGLGVVTDTGFDPGRNNLIDCVTGAGMNADIGFQEDALIGLIDNNIRLIHIDSSGSEALIPYWSVWTQGTGGAFGRATTNGTPIVESGTITLPDFIVELLSSMPVTPP